MDTLTIMPYIWIGLIILFLLVEATTYNLITIWFSIGSIVPLILSLFNVSLAIQLVAFLLVSGLLVYLTRPIAAKMRTKYSANTNTNTIVGKIGTANQDILANERGYVHVNGIDWLAIPDVNIANNEKVVVVRLEGSKIYVTNKGEK